MVLGMFKNILFVCVGNICRSPVAEYWARAALQKKGFQDTNVSSAGLEAMVSWPIASEMKLILDRFQIDASKHVARQMNPEIAAHADIIFTMETWQREELFSALPSIRGKTFCLGKWLDQEITDPYHQPQSVFETVFESISKNWEIWQNKLWCGCN